MSQLTPTWRAWLIRAAAYRELQPAIEAEQRAEADAIPDAVGPVRRGGLSTREAERLLAEWHQRTRPRVRAFRVR